MRWFPLFLDIKDRKVVVVGGGTIAERKIDLFQSAGPKIAIVSPIVTESLAARVAAGQFTWEARSFEEADVIGATVIVAATDSPDVNQRVAAAATARGIPVNVVDDLELSTGILPAIVDRSPLVIAVSTEGSAPAFARYVRARIESAIDESFGDLATFLRRMRDRIKQRFPDLGQRRRFYGALLEGEVPDALRRRRPIEAEAAFEHALHAGVQEGGRVDLVGAGPGDPGLLTLNALRALQAADVVLHDRLVSADVLALCRREAELIPVGKAAGYHSVPQDEINALLVQHARAGRRVVRLKGGDPFVFGRGGEEIEVLAALRIPYSVVPGVTAAIACGAYAGIPLTHRDHARGVRFVTAHCKSALDSVDWASLAHEKDTLAVYMGVGSISRIEAELLAHGSDPETPVAFIENGSRPEQRVVVGTLAGAHALAAREQIGSPALLIIGSVVSLAERLAWFGATPVIDRANDRLKRRCA
jgi:uroporphyrin-III C-methyltransferase/precorrin-2 dehydrogenase/sirohydrochlorin ferrochelatase